MGEFEIIKRYFTWDDLKSPFDDLRLGVGDDCALLSPDPQDGLLCVTTDTMVERVHFFQDLEPYLTASKALLSNLSDLAGMGATPSSFTLSLIMPKDFLPFLPSFSSGLKDVAAQCPIALIGGNLSSGPILSITISAYGYAKHPMRRNAAANGYLVAVTGGLGGAGLYVELKNGTLPRQDDDLMEEAKLRYARPPCRVAFASALSSLCPCALDISDGLCGDLRHILSQSGVGAELEADKVPLDEVLQKADLPLKTKYDLALYGGGDYELLCAFDEQNLGKIEDLAKSFEVPLTVIGRITSKVPAGQICLDLDNGHRAAAKSGFEHF